MGDASGKPRSFIEQARRDQIERAAIEVIAEHGYGAATFARIAERAGVSPALISYHFTSRSELITSVVEGIRQRLDEALDAAIEGSATYTAALRSLIEGHVAFTAGHTTDSLALVQIFSSTDLADIRPTAGQRSEWIDEIESMLRDAQTDGEFTDFDTRPVAMALLAALEAAPAQLHLRPDIDATAFARELADMFEVVTTTRRKRPRRARRGSASSGT